MRTLLFLSVLAGCTNATNAVSFAQCEVAFNLPAGSVIVGEQIRGTGGPFTETYDTVIRVAGINAELVSVQPADCPECESCRAEFCDSCSGCDACASVCELCVDSVDFVVPDLTSGEVNVALSNRLGQSNAVPITIVQSQAARQ